MLVRISLRWNLTWEIKFCFLIPKTRFCGSYFVEVRTKFYQVYLLLMCIPHFNLLKHFKQHMTVCSLSLHLAEKLKNKNLSFKSALVRNQWALFIQLIYSRFLFTILPPIALLDFLHINTHSTHDSSNRHNEGLALESATFKLLTGANLRSFIINSVDNTKLFCYYSPTNVAPQFL